MLQRHLLPGVAGAVLAVLSSGTLAAQFVPPSYVEAGSNCIASNNLVYELFPAGTVIDLAGETLRFALRDGGYDVSLTAEPALPFGASSPTAINIDARDDAVDGGRDLTFAFPYVDAAGAQRSTNRLFVVPNGHVYLQQDTEPRCCDGEQALALATGPNAVPAFSIFGVDIDAEFGSPSGGGVIWFDEQTVRGQQVAVVTWDGVNEFDVSPPVAQTMQMQLWADGTVHFVYISVVASEQPCLVGWSAGADDARLGQPDFGGTDFSAGPLRVESDRISVPVSLDLSDPPIEGRPLELSIGGVPNGAVGAAIVFGTNAQSVALDSIGAPSCFSLVGVPRVGVFPALIGGSSAVIDFGMLPSDAGGVRLSVQGLVAIPGANPLGVVTTERGEITIGDEFDSARGVRFVARGPNSFNSDTSRGFWTLTHDDPARAGLQITELVMDAAVNGTPHLFDTDATGIGGRFDGGDASGPCAYTYRNGTETGVGLVFSGTASSPCSGSMAPGTGWIASVPGSLVNDFRVLRFQFTDFSFGEVFEFDADTDNPVDGGVAGDEMAGIQVTVRFSDGSVSTATLFAVDDEVAGAIL